MATDKVNILIVDDQASKLISHSAVLHDLGETILTAASARQAFEILLKNDVAVVLIDVCMPETDGFELATMIQQHPRFQRTAIIFISAVLSDDVDRLRGYQVGAVDYMSVPVIPEVLRAKVKVFVDLYRKTHQLEQLNRNLEARVAERTAALAASTTQLRQAEQLRSLALAAGQMGSWEWNIASGKVSWDQGQHDIFGVEAGSFVPTARAVKALIHPDDLPQILETFHSITAGSKTFQTEFRVRRSNGEIRSCIGVVAASFNTDSQLMRICGVTVDITDRKRAEEHRMLLAEEVDHRARNVVAVIQAIMRLTRAPSIEEYVASLDGRIHALSTAHKLLATSRWEGADLQRLVDEEFAPYKGRDIKRVEITGPPTMLPPATAQTIALALHELVTNAAKYGALSVDGGRIEVNWETSAQQVTLRWLETNGPPTRPPSRTGYGTRVIKSGIEGQLNGKAEFDWQHDGLKCTLIVPRPGNKAGKLERAHALTNEAFLTGVTTSNRAGPQILIVEDEPMISMMLTDVLAENGQRVDGPYSSLDEALIAATHNELKAGILDVNVSGASVYPIADILTRRNIPFIFVTGYASDAIESRFRNVPVLQKPIEPQRVWAALSQRQHLNA